MINRSIDLLVLCGDFQGLGPPYALEVLGPAPAPGPRTAICALSTLSWGSSELAALPRCGQQLTSASAGPLMML